MTVGMVYLLSKVGSREPEVVFEDVTDDVRCDNLRDDVGVVLELDSEVFSDVDSVVSESEVVSEVESEMV